MNHSSDTSIAVSPSAGHIDIYIELNAQGFVSSVEIENHRPQAIGQFLTSISPEAALDRIPKVFLLCSQAQQIAAAGAIAKAKGISPSVQFKKLCAERSALEWLKEHSWQLWQMERELFGQEFAMQESLDLTRFLLSHLRQPALTLEMALASDLPTLDASIWPEIEQKLSVLFGIDPGEFLKLDWSGLMDWLQTQAPYAQLLHALMADEINRFGAFEAWTVADETGAMVRQQHPLLEQAIEQAGASLVTRTLARLIELATVCVTPHIAEPKQLGSAEASRGELNHQLSLDSQGLISDYRLDAPTDRLFRAEGLLERSLSGQELPMQDLKWARLLVWSIDPCVEFFIKRKQ